MNWYTYAANNPVQYVDPAGLEPWSIIDYDGGFTYAAKLQRLVGGILKGLRDRWFSPGQSSDHDTISKPFPQEEVGPIAGEEIPQQVPITTRDVLETAAGVAITKGVAGTKRNPNKLASVQDADGPHSSFRRDPNGRVSNYETYDKNPHNGQWTAAKRFRGSGKEHGGVEPPLVLERSEGKGPGSKPVVPRAPEPWELPKGY